MNWDDLRIVLAVRDEGSYARAGASLKLDETTVARRLARLERSLGTRLFEAVDGRREPTSHCHAVLLHVEEISTRVAKIVTVGRDFPTTVGRVRLVTTDSIAEHVLGPRTAGLLTAYPGITLQLLISGQNVNFSRWEADLAVRLRKPQKGNFTISKLADVRLYLFEPSQLRAEDASVVCCYPDDLDETPESQYIERKGLKQRARCITDNIATIRALVRSGMGIGVLPEYACGALLEDRELRATQLPKSREVWLLAQSHLKKDGAARVTIDWLRKAFSEIGD
jgi:DNA-binding transcriptional LysR family regulator